MKERYHISGMTCSACSSHVEKAAGRLDGVKRVSVNLLTETMEIEYEEERLGRGEIEAAVRRAGYGASLMGNAAAEGQNAEKPYGDGKSRAAGERDGIRKKAQEDARGMRWRLGISIGFLLPLMYVAMYPMYSSWFGLPVPEVVHCYLHGGENAMTLALTQLLLLLPILYMNRKFFAVGFRALRHLSPNMDSLIAIGATAAIGYGIFAMYRISYGLGHGNMALVEQYSHDLYFESAGMILTLITVGKYLESRSKGKTSEAITRLMDLSPRTAILLREDGTECEVPTEEVRQGDIFLIKPGSLVPVDGTVLEGNSSIDEAAITGESIPVEKREGDRVVSATVNKSGFLKCRADRVGEDTTLSQIIRLVEEASASKAPMAQLADKVAGVFVPVVMAIALVTLLVWLAVGAGAEFAISTAIAVLVISCPCALGLATPVAVMVGTGVGANHGILIKSGEALQLAREIDTVVLDKTGTVTSGRLRVMGVGCFAQDMSVDTLVRLAAALEKKSEHPLAEAVVEYAERRHLAIPEVSEFRAVFGRGIEGTLAEELLPAPFFSEKDGATAVFVAGKTADGRESVLNLAATPRGNAKAQVLAENLATKTDAGVRAGTRLIVGNAAFMQEKGIVISDEVQAGLDEVAEEGRTPLLVAEVLAAGGRLLGTLDVADGVRPSSVQAIQRFQKMGIRVVMLTGDNRKTAEAVRRLLGIEEVIAEVLPQDKEKKIRKLREEGRRVAMIGDGINDAPALAAADVGMAIGAGTDVAMESADIVLMKSDLRDAVTAVRLSRRVIRNIKQNLFWAFFYNAIGIPLAAGVWYPMFAVRLSPMFGAAAMSLSSIFVVGNALRLRRFRDDFTQAGRSVTAQEVKGAPCAVSGEERAQGVSCAPQKVRTRIGEQKGEKKKMTKVMKIEGMMCGHCTGRVQKALEALEGVSSVTMSLEEKTATVELAGEVGNEQLTAAVTEAGYEVTGIEG